MIYPQVIDESDHQDFLNKCNLEQVPDGHVLVSYLDVVNKEKRLYKKTELDMKDKSIVSLSEISRILEQWDDQDVRRCILHIP